MRWQSLFNITCTVDVNENEENTPCGRSFVWSGWSGRSGGVSCGVVPVDLWSEMHERYELGESPPRLDMRNVARESRRRQKDRKSSFHSFKSSIIDDFLPTV